MRERPQSDSQHDSQRKGRADLSEAEVVPRARKGNEQPEQTHRGGRRKREERRRSPRPPGWSLGASPFQVEIDADAQPVGRRRRVAQRPDNPPKVMAVSREIQDGQPWKGGVSEEPADIAQWEIR